MAQDESKNRMISSADLLRKGASLLREPCPRCGGLQMKYQGNVYCLNEDNLNTILSGGQVAVPPTPRQQEKKPESLQAKAEDTDSLRKLLEGKLAAVSKQLDETSDVDEQGKLLDLISKYVETLNKLKKP